MIVDVSAFKAVLAEVVRDVVREELKTALGAPRPLTKNELAVALGCSTATVDRHVRRGMRYTQEGGHRMFDLDACRAWLRDRPPPEEKEPDDVLTQGVVRKPRRVAA